uniref:NADH dehydrogenase subunit 2 n=1 Tax=Odontella aurita TaxID=265563 RepID=UPI00202771CD|nr:NADH dehydrogenase subunit 2 [Odontella aurita]QYB22939.1 NADH dehydrogenase subunit 2 [Odontella aurita]
MINDTLMFNEIGLLPEMFLIISVVYFLMYGTFLSTSKNYPLIHITSLNLSILVLFLLGFLIINDKLIVTKNITFNYTIAQDYLSFFAKFLAVSASVFCMIFIYQYIKSQKINQFEYFLLFLLGILGVLLLCSSNDLITAYLAIELQSLSFYVLAGFKKNSTFSVDAGLKYFILGAFSSSLFLFGSSIIYGVTGTLTFTDIRELFFWIFPASNSVEYFLNHYTIHMNDILLMDSLLEKMVLVELTNSLLNALPSNNVLVEKFNNYPNESIIEFFFDDNFPQSQEDDSFVFQIIQNLESISQSLRCFYSKTLNQNTIFYHKTFNVNFLQFAIIFIFISLFFKLALAPFHLWSPDVYEGSLSSSTFFFVVVPKIGIFILLIRLCYYCFYGFIDNWRYFLVIISIISIIVGSFVGLEQRKLKSLLAYSSISHMGYSVIAFSCGTFEGLQMLFSYLIIYICSGLCIWSLFLVTRIKTTYFKKQNKDLTDFVLLKRSNKMLAIFFATVLLSIAGFPPMIGFLVKIGIFLAALESSMYFVGFISILISVISTFYYIRIIKIAFFEKVLVGRLYYPITFQKIILLVGLFYFLIYLFINPAILYLFSYKICLTFL